MPRRCRARKQRASNGEKQDRLPHHARRALGFIVGLYGGPFRRPQVSDLVARRRSTEQQTLWIACQREDLALAPTQRTNQRQVEPIVGSDATQISACPLRCEARRADTPDSGVKDLEPLQRLTPDAAGPRPTVNRRTATASLTVKGFSPPEDAEPPQSGIVFWAGGVLSKQEPLDRSAVIVRVYAAVRAVTGHK